MSFTIPGDFATIIKATIQGAGEDVVWTRQATGVETTIRASVQRPGSSLLVGDALQEGFIVFTAGDAFGAVEPVRFDRLTISGEDRAIEEALPIQAGGVIHAWQLRVLG
jgi:hypothetical protein